MNLKCLRMISEKEMQFTCDTVGNQSTLHPCTSAVIVTVEGDLNTKVTVQMNEQIYQATIGELLQYGYTSHMKYYHSQAFKIHKALPESRYIFNIEYLQHFYNLIEENHGSIQNFLRNAVGLTEDEENALRNKYLI